MTSTITPLLLTYNEEANLGRTLARLKWAGQVVVVDSFSTDRTCEIVRSHPGAILLQRPFDTFSQQCNFGLEQIRTPWVLSLDADYVLTPELVEELASLDLNNSTAGYSASFRYCIHGRPLRASLYPPRVVLYRRNLARYHDDGHGHRVRINGEVRSLRSQIEHDDRKSIDRWLTEQSKYAVAEAKHLLESPPHRLKRVDRIRLGILFAPALVFLYTLLWKRLLFDGWPGWFYVAQRTVAESLLSLRLIECRLKDQSGSPG